MVEEVREREINGIIESDDGVDDMGTLDFADEKNDRNVSVYPATNIKIDRVQFSIFELKRRFDRGTVKLDPEFQRNFVWKTKQKSELIESVIMGIPLPLIYLAETMEGNLVIVDGRQRLTTFFSYLDNEFALNNLKILPDLNSCKFKDLEQDEKKRKYAADIEDFQLVIQIIKYPTPDRVRFDIFDRVNRGGTPLNNQEMRNALYQGSATRLLSRLADTESFKKATGYSIQPTHMKDKYIILRSLAFYLYNEGKLCKTDGEPVKYRSDMEEFLGYTMENLNRMNEGELQKIEQLFDEVMVTSYRCLGENAFRIPAEGRVRRPVSMTLFESLFYFVFLLDREQRESSDEEIRQGVWDMLEDSVFLNALTYNVDSAVHVEQRFEVVKKIYKRMRDA